MSWFGSYLHNRRQYVSINGIKSSTKIISYGVPQGSLLGLSLFLFFINDLPSVIENAQITLFADDTTISFSHPNYTSLIQNVNTNLSNVYSWCIANKLTINVSKTESILISKRKLENHSELSPIFLGNDSIQFSSSCKFLGVTIDERLSFQTHLNLTANKLSQTVGLLYRIRNLLDERAKLAFYYGLLYPILNYNIIFWGGTYSSSLDPIFILQKRAIRIICNAPYNYHTTSLFHRLKILKLTDIYRYNVCIHMFHKLKFSNLYAVTHTLNTRNRSMATPVYHRLTCTQHAVSFLGPTIWNSLPSSLKQIDGLPTFRKELKNFFINSYD